MPACNSGGNPPPSYSGDRWFLVALMAVTFGLHLTAIAVLTGLDTRPTPGSDPSEYDAYAWNVAQGRGYRGLSIDVTDRDHLTAYRPPTAPLYYAAIYAVFGHSYVAANVCNSVLAALTPLLVYGIARRCFGRKAALLAAAVYAFYPIAIYLNLTLISETQASFLVLLFVWCCLPIKGSRGVYWALGAGFVLGALLLCKPGFVFLVPLLPLWAWIVCGRERRLWLRAGLIPLCSGLVLAPWVVRNQLVFGAFIPFSTLGGNALLGANNRLVVEDPALYGYCTMDHFLPEYRPALRAVDDEVKRDEVAKKFAVEWLWANTDKWFYLARMKFLRLWTPQYQGVERRWLRLPVSGYYALILAFFVAGVVPITAKFLRERHPAVIMQFLIASTIAMALVFQGQHRYRFPIDGLCIIMAAASVVWFLEVGVRHPYGAMIAPVLACAARHKALVAVGALAAVGLMLACLADQAHIDAYRHQEDRKKLEAIRQAVVAYCEAHGRLPATVADLVPAYLPNVDSLHCPWHSAGWKEYLLLSSQEPRSAAHMISYEIVQAAEARPDAVRGECGRSAFAVQHLPAAQP
jgi:4-amino-4-deoxy-L-arabinose transferase-like glycosyltransferase